MSEAGMDIHLRATNKVETNWPMEVSYEMQRVLAGDKLSCAILYTP